MLFMLSVITRGKFELHEVLLIDLYRHIVNGPNNFCAGKEAKGDISPAQHFGQLAKCIRGLCCNNAKTDTFTEDEFMFIAEGIRKVWDAGLGNGNKNLPINYHFLAHFDILQS
jgi:hypothetical protein